MDLNYCTEFVISLCVWCRSSIDSVTSWFWSIWTAWRSDSGIPDPHSLTSKAGAVPPAGSLHHPISICTPFPFFLLPSKSSKKETRQKNRESNFCLFTPNIQALCFYFSSQIFSVCFSVSCEQFCKKLQSLASAQRGWLTSARSICEPFLKTAALFFTCLFLFGWLTGLRSKNKHRFGKVLSGI